jgi:hypothetical protein
MYARAVWNISKGRSRESIHCKLWKNFCNFYIISKSPPQQCLFYSPIALALPVGDYVEDVRHAQSKRQPTVDIVRIMGDSALKGRLARVD